MIVIKSQEILSKEHLYDENDGEYQEYQVGINPVFPNPWASSLRNFPRFLNKEFSPYRRLSARQVPNGIFMLDIVDLNLCYLCP
jgi:hypothetical protein